MNRTQVLACLYAVDEAFDLPARSDKAIEAKAEVWLSVLGKYPANVGLAATRRLIDRDSGFAPKPGQIAAECRRLLGSEPPSLEAAFGLWRAGRRDTHPAVAAAAARCTVDARRSDPKTAWFDFRAQYEAVLWEAREADAAPVREALGISGPQVAEVVALPSPRQPVESTADPVAAKRAFAEIRGLLRKPKSEGVNL